MPPSWKRSIGIGIVRLFRAMPPLFAAVCLLGIGTGLYLTISPDDEIRYPRLLQGFGLLMVVMYAAAAAFWTRKVCRGTWGPFCDWWIDVVERAR